MSKSGSVFVSAEARSRRRGFRAQLPEFSPSRKREFSQRAGGSRLAQRLPFAALWQWSPRHRTRHGQALGAELPEFSPSESANSPWRAGRRRFAQRPPASLWQWSRATGAGQGQALGAELPESSPSRKREFSLARRGRPARTTPSPSRRCGNGARATGPGQGQALGAEPPEPSSSRKREFSLARRGRPARTTPSPSRRCGDGARATGPARDRRLEPSFQNSRLPESANSPWRAGGARLAQRPPLRDVVAMEPAPPDPPGTGFWSPASRILAFQKVLSRDNQDGCQRQSGWMTPGSAGGRA